jgi:hypothetical protein
MHAFAIIAVILAVVGFGLIALASAESGPSRRGWRVVTGVLGASFLIATVSIWASLVFAEPQVCELLGGESVVNGPDRACRNEWGGNGSNDPGTSWVPWA